LAVLAAAIRDTAFGATPRRAPHSAKAATSPPCHSRIVPPVEGEHLDGR
jgi:hypothetical protein